MRRLLVIMVGAGLLAGTALAASPSAPRLEHTKKDNTLAASVLLTIKDFGTTGWKATKVAPPWGLSLSCAQFNSKESDVTETGAAASPDLATTTGQYIEILQRVSVFKTAAQATTLWNRTQKAKFADCVGDIFAAYQSKFTVGQIKTGVEKIAKVTPATKTAAYKAETTLTSLTGGGKPTVVILDAVLLQKGRMITGIYTTSTTTGGPELTGADLAFEADFAAKLMSKLPKN